MSQLIKPTTMAAVSGVLIVMSAWLFDGQYYLLSDLALTASIVLLAVSIALDWRRG